MSSSDRRVPVFWKDQIVGEVEDVKCDNLNVYGKWIPGQGVHSTLFLQELSKGTELLVTIGDRISGILDEVPRDELEIKMNVD